MKFALRAALVLSLLLATLLVWAGYLTASFFIPVAAIAKPAANRSHLVVVYFSGDVGYKLGVGRMLGDRLANDGIPTLAINSLSYFRARRSLAEVRELTANAITQALAFAHADKVVLVGHSLGADVLQAGLIGLSPSLRAKVQAVALIVPTDMLYLQVSPGEMLGWSEPEGATVPTLRRLDWVPFTCIYGIDETDSPCRLLDGSNFHRVGLPGGHALDWDIDAIHKVLLQAIDATHDSSNKTGLGDPVPRAIADAAHVDQKIYAEK